MSGSELSKAKEDAAAIMRAKQAAGMLTTIPPASIVLVARVTNGTVTEYDCGA
jgi:hypothetical protein